MALALAAALVLAGCGAETNVDVDQVKSVVERFSLSHDASACDLLSANALTDLYGKFDKKNVARAHANCVEKAQHFKGEPVTIDNVNVIDNDRVRVSALDQDGVISYGVSLRRYGSKWLIESISQAKND
jgi:hypothetical protein